ncbi:MAG: hypothetical protein J6V58_05990 [Clostridia bacterium]|nr:hypothetical protein [Clostridia bacterium]
MTSRNTPKLRYLRRGSDDFCHPKVIEYRGDAARLYYITSYKPNPTGNVVILEYYDGSWHYVGEHTVWSTMGSADEAIWPYWWHYFTR